MQEIKQGFRTKYIVKTFRGNTASILKLTGVKREESEIGYDAFRYIERENRLTFRKTRFILNTTEFYDAVTNVNKSKEHVLMVLFYVPCKLTSCSLIKY